MSIQGVQMEDEKIKIRKKWLKPKSLLDIQGFLGFANFHQRIYDFGKMA